MTTYIVTFEVNNADRENALVERLQQYDRYCPIHGNCWAVVSDKTAAEIRDFLDETLDVSDRIFVIRSGVAAAWRNTYGEKNTEWLKERL